ncbi:hypothetical protein ACHAXA_009539 [Cyclostephanos tholiformis]|uniref:Uncharacterized protein n=1 Tax=Cyclostephanos tholiformis TaxID=382380 RepID=A0ABD3R6H5_9STRA
MTERRRNDGAAFPGSAGTINSNQGGDGERRRGGGGRRRRHDDRRLSTRVPVNAYKRTHLAHDDVECARMRLVTTRIQRKVDALRAMLEDWDPLEDPARYHCHVDDDHDDDDDDDDDDGGKLGYGGESSDVKRRIKLDINNRKMDVEARTKAHAEICILQARHGVNSSTHRRTSNLRKKPRPGPETWKLRGAARPAHEVYEFDVRHVDVHRRALDEANARARRVVNVMRVCRGRFAVMEGDGNDVDVDGGGGTSSSSLAPPQPHCRNLLSLLTQLGSMHLHRKNYSSARRAFLEAIELEGYEHGHSITNARYRLMNMYLSNNRPDSARALWEKLSNDDSAWIRYSEALIEYASWNVLNERGSDSVVAELALTRAIRGNVYVAYLLGWSRTFERAMEYTDEVVDGGVMVGKVGGSLLEAIEYACRCYRPPSSTSGDGDGMPGQDDDDDNDDDDDRDAGMAMWLGTDGSIDWVRSVILRVLNEEDDDDEDGKVEGGGPRSANPDRLTKADLLCWEVRLNGEEEEFERRERKEKGGGRGISPGQCAGLDNEDDNDDVDDIDKGPDVAMYAGMFRTAMDWLQDAGEFLREPSYNYVRHTGKDEDVASDEDDDHQEEWGKGEVAHASIHNDESSSEEDDSSSCASS